ncbi:MAG: Uma2 family endonuclease [Armatimonadetes bacterium]|nr:Uma2 family endonuclease [Armatimonadota bacterium]
MVGVKAMMSESEFMRLPDDGRKYEMVDREAKEAPAGMRHDEIVMRAGVALYPYARGRGALSGSQAGFRMEGGNIRSPDISFTRKERLPGGQSPIGFGEAAPDLCIEVISPSEDWEDAFRKIGEYFASGAEEVWLLRPEARQATVYRSLLETRVYGPEDRLGGGDLLPGLACRVEKLFEVG